MTTRDQLAFGGIVAGLLLIVVGVSAYAVTDFDHITALIPALFGVVMAALGGLIVVEAGYDRQAAYGLGLLAALGILGSLRGAPDIVALLIGANPDSTVGAISQGLMILLSLVVLGLTVMYLRNQH